MRNRNNRAYRRDSSDEMYDAIQEFEVALEAIVDEADYVDRHVPYVTPHLICNLHISGKGVQVFLWYRDEEEIYTTDIDMPRFDIDDFKVSRDVKADGEYTRGVYEFVYEGDDIWLLKDKKVLKAFEQAFMQAYQNSGR